MGWRVVKKLTSSSEVRERLDRVLSESREPVGPNRNKMSRKGPSDRPRSGTRQRRSTIKRCEAAAAALRERDGAMFTRHSAKIKYSGVQSASDGVEPIGSLWEGLSGEDEVRGGDWMPKTCRPEGLPWEPRDGPVTPRAWRGASTGPLRLLAMAKFLYLECSASRRSDLNLATTT